MPQAAGQNQQVSPFPTIPDVQPNMGSVISTLQALTKTVNILIVNAQANPQNPNLTGTQIFAKVSDVKSASQKAQRAVEQAQRTDAQLTTISQRLTNAGIP
jgi:hypothetical protein